MFLGFIENFLFSGFLNKIFEDKLLGQLSFFTLENDWSIILEGEDYKELREFLAPRSIFHTCLRTEQTNKILKTFSESATRNDESAHMDLLLNEQKNSLSQCN